MTKEDLKYHEYTVEDLIRDLSMLPDGVKKMPVGCMTPNGQFHVPHLYSITENDDLYGENIAICIHYSK